MLGPHRHEEDGWRSIVVEGMSTVAIGEMDVDATSTAACATTWVRSDAKKFSAGREDCSEVSAKGNVVFIHLMARLMSSTPELLYPIHSGN